MLNPIHVSKGWVLLLSLWAISASAELRIEIRQGVEKAIPVAIVPFGWEGTGAALAMSVMEAAVRMFKEVLTFEEAGVANK